MKSTAMHNTIDITVQDKKGNYIAKSCKVCLHMSKSAMLEFGKELIRNALKDTGGDVYHFNPAGTGLGIDIRFGVMIHPKSVEPIIIDDIEPTIDTGLQEELISNADSFASKNTNDEKQKMLEDNIVFFEVCDLTGRDIGKDCRYVIIYLHKYSKIALGMELIRLTHNFEEGKEVHIIPASKENGAKQSMGIFLTPDSCELTIRCEHFEPIEKYLEEYKATKGLK